EVAYEETPVRPLLSLQGGLVDLVGQLAEVKVPLLLMNSPDDHVVDPGDSEHLAEVYGGSVERVSLDHSFHVATQDEDQGLIIERSLQFIDTVTT
ncbi:MAG: alpha/beta hydrolase, partial [Actinobacteria bacterium]|nr:alpha/beta hydrolase [Actinomycetota bacterium]